MIDSQGYRANVGIILCNQKAKVFWARRVSQDAWQFPQGGVKRGESPDEALFRELKEEVGLDPDHVRLLARSSDWLRYDLPQRLIRYDREPLCVGQKQRWYLLRLTADEELVQLDCSGKPEFDCWRWVSYWHPLKEVVAFKREVYRSALWEFAPLLFPRRERTSRYARD